MYVRLKEVKGEIYGQVVEGFREAGRVRQRNIIGLGRNCDVAGALDDVERDLGRCRRRLKKLSDIYPPDGADMPGWALRETARLRARLTRQAERRARLLEVQKSPCPLT